MAINQLSFLDNFLQCSSTVDNGASREGHQDLPLDSSSAARSQSGHCHTSCCLSKVCPCLVPYLYRLCVCECLCVCVCVCVCVLRGNFRQAGWQAGLYYMSVCIVQ